MSAPRESMPVVYHDDAKMQNGGNEGDGSGQIVPQVVQPEQVEEIGNARTIGSARGHSRAAYATQDSTFHYLMALAFSCTAPQYHWHAMQWLRGCQR